MKKLIPSRRQAAMSHRGNGQVDSFGACRSFSDKELLLPLADLNRPEASTVVKLDDNRLPNVRLRRMKVDCKPGGELQL